MHTNDVDGGGSATHHDPEEEILEIRKGPWTEEEDSLLVNYIKNHGEGHWNFLAYSSGLKRTGKSCRYRWLNYLRPGIRRGNFTPQEQLKIIELQLRWGNRWSKIAECLHGRTDNQIKNYWRTRVQKQAKLLNCDVNSNEFKDAMRNVLIPRLAEHISREETTRSPSPQLVTGDDMALLITPAGTSSEVVVRPDQDDHDKVMGSNYNCIQVTTPAANDLSLNNMQSVWPFQQNDVATYDDQFGDSIYDDIGYIWND